MDAAMVVDAAEVVVVADSVDVMVTVGGEAVVVPGSLSLGSSLITMEGLSLLLLFTRHIMRTPIAVVITQAKRQAKKMFHRDQLQQPFPVT